MDGRTAVRLGGIFGLLAVVVMIPAYLVGYPDAPGSPEEASAYFGAGLGTFVFLNGVLPLFHVFFFILFLGVLYVQALRDPSHVHAICEEYRAAATIDREHDEADRASGHRIVCPLLALWSAKGPLDTWYEEEGGLLSLWRAWGDDVRGHALNAGHFFPEEAPEQTADALNHFFSAAESS
jgi:pimeloyl-ACP methyl ester carboxylesterase